VESDATSVAKYNYSSMALHECISKAWRGALALAHEGTGEEGGALSNTVLLQGVEVRWGARLTSLLVPV
jgi:hypothetical protein